MARTATKQPNAVVETPPLVRAPARARTNDKPMLPALVPTRPAPVPAETALLPMPREQAQTAMNSAMARFDRLNEEIAALNQAKSDLYAELKDIGFDLKIVRQVQKERRIDPTLRQINAQLFDLYFGLLIADARHEAAE